MMITPNKANPRKASNTVILFNGADKDILFFTFLFYSYNCLITDLLMPFQNFMDICLFVMNENYMYSNLWIFNSENLTIFKEFR